MNKQLGYRVEEKFPGFYLIYNDNAEDLMVARQNLVIERNKKSNERTFTKIIMFLFGWLAPGGDWNE